MVYTYCRNFNDNQTCESLRTEKTLQVFYNPEPNFWIVIVIYYFPLINNTIFQNFLSYC